MQQGVVDGAENNPTALTNSRHGEVAKVYSLDEHTMIPDVLLISSKAWDKLTKEEQEAVKKAADDSMAYHKVLWKEMTDAAVEKAKESMNVKVVQVEKQPFIDAVKPMHDEALKKPCNCRVRERHRCSSEVMLDRGFNRPLILKTNEYKRLYLFLHSYVCRKIYRFF